MMRYWRQLRAYLITLGLGVSFILGLNLLLAEADRKQIETQQIERLNLLEINLSRALLQQLFLTEWLAADLSSHPDIVAELSETGVIIQRFYPLIEQIFWINDSANEAINGQAVLPESNWTKSTDRRLALNAKLTPLLNEVPPGSAVISQDPLRHVLIASRIDNDVNLGKIVLLIDLEQLLQEVMRVAIQEGDQLLIFNPQEELYLNIDSRDLYYDWRVSSQLRLANQVYTIELWPSPQRLAQMTFLSPPQRLTINLILVGLLGYALWLQYLKQQGQRRQQQLAERIHATEDQFKRREYQLRSSLELDPLTQLPHHTQFIRELRERLKEVNSQPLSLLYLTLPHSMNLTASLGLSITDKLVQKISRRLLRNCTDGQQIARIGYAEWVVMSPAQQAALFESEELWQQLNSKAFIDEFELCPYLRHSSMTIESDNLSAEFILTSLAQQTAANALSDTPTALASVTDHDCARALCRSVNNEQLLIMAEPIRNIRSQNVVAIATKAFWRLDEYRLMQPRELEQNINALGLIEPFTRELVRQSFALWQAATSLQPSLNLQIRLSLEQLHWSELVPLLKSQLLRTEVEARNLTLIIDCRAAQTVSEASLLRIKELESLGVEIGLLVNGMNFDLAQLLDENWLQMVTIDADIIAKLPADSVAATLVHQLLEITHMQQIDCLAEGVQNQQQLDFLLQRQCQYAAGGIISAPLSKEQLLLRIRQWQSGSE